MRHGRTVQAQKAGPHAGPERGLADQEQQGKECGGSEEQGPLGRAREEAGKVGMDRTMKSEVCPLGSSFRSDWQFKDR